MISNPFANIEKILGLVPGAFQAAKTQVEIFLRANDDKQQIDESLVRAAVIPQVSNRVWNEIKKDLGMTG